MNQELLSRKSLSELETYYSAQKIEAVAKGEYEKANFYKSQITNIQQLASLDAQIQAKVQAEDYLAANSLQQQYNALKSQTLAARFGQTTPVTPSTSSPTPRGNTLQTRALLSNPKAPSTSSGSATTPVRSSKSSSKSTQKYYVAQTTTMAFADYTNFTEGELMMGMENTHLWNTMKVKPIKGNQLVNHGGLIGSISYGWNYFDFQVDGLGTYGTGYWAKGGIGYAYHNEMGSVFGMINQGIVFYNESTTSFYDWDGYYDWIDQSNTAWFPENSMSLKFGVVAHPKFNKKSTQWGVSLIMDTPIDGFSSLFWIGLSTTGYKKYR